MQFQITVKVPLGTEDHTVDAVDRGTACGMVIAQHDCTAGDIMRVREIRTERTLEDDRTMKQLAQEALDVQNASNLIAVANSFGKALKRLRALDVRDVRAHAITLLWVDKIADMTGRERDLFTESYSKVTEMAAVVD